MNDDIVFFMNNCGGKNNPGGRNHAKMYGTGAFYDLNTDGKQGDQAVDLRKGQVCIVASKAPDGRITFEWYSFTEEKILPDTEGDHLRVFFGSWYFSETLPKAEAACSVRYKSFFKQKGKTKGDFKNGSVSKGVVAPHDRPPTTKRLLAKAEQQLVEERAFDPTGIEDARERILSSIVRRRGQSAFRTKLLEAYEGRCAITGCEAEAVLEAAHVVSYKGEQTNHVANGLLLRADLHTLFDLGLVAVDVATMQVLVSPELAGTEYATFQGKKMSVPDDPASQPSKEALQQHQRQSGLNAMLDPQNR